MSVLKSLLNLFPQKTVFAHCDIPCGIYDPTAAQIGAHTVLRMTQLLEKVSREDETSAEHDIARMTHVKEKHGEMVEEELGTLENDYFKPEHFDANSGLQDLLKDAVKLSITSRQHIDLEAAQKLLEKILQISEIFYKSKGFEPVRIPSGFPTEGEMVIHK